MNSVGQFKYNPEELSRHIFIITKKCIVKSGWMKKMIHLLQGKFGPSEHEKYTNYILLKILVKYLLKKIFLEKSSLFNMRWQ